MAYFEMFTDQGDQACTRALDNIKTIINGERFISEAELKAIVKAEVKQVSIDHPEVYDTEPEWHFVDRITKVLQTKGYAYSIDRRDLY